MPVEKRDYPYVDEHGTTWLAPDTLKSNEPGPCFYCGVLTDRVDINFAAFFCGSDADEAAIDIDLRKKAGEYDGEYDEDIIRWYDEGGHVQ